MARQSPFMSSAQFTYPTSYQQRDGRYGGVGPTVESAMALNRRPSLLAGYHNHFGSQERTSLAPYYLSVAPVSMGPHVDEHSKRSRFPTGGNLAANSQLLPLSIEVKKEQQVYQPQTEAISPTPDDPKVDSNMRDSTIIRNSISKLESEIDITAKKLHRAKLSQNEIKSQADKSAADEDENDDRDGLWKTNGSQTLIEKILHDNRRKAEDSQRVLNHLNNNMDLTIPLYQEPNDLESIRKIRTQYMSTMKHRLKEFFKKTHESSHRRLKSESNRYDQVYQEWQRSIEKDEKTISSNELAIYRETFEKTFPELRKTREDKEKKQANTSESTSSEQTQQPSVNASTIEQDLEVEEDKMRKSSVIPPIMYNAWQRKHQYFNQNGLIKDDAAEFYKERTKMPDWSADEKQIFIEKFTQSPKNFGFISSFLENKTTEQCIQFYYMTKKTENYKNLLRKQTQANKRRAKQTTSTMTATMVSSSTTIETTLVTKVTSSNTIVSSSSRQMLGHSGAAQDADRSTDRGDNDDDRREANANDANDEKRANKNRCQLLSCTTEKTGKKKNRKNRLRAFPTKWNELTEESCEAIRRSLQIPQNVQRCCTRCYEKLIIQVRQRQTSTQPMEEDDDDEDASKIPSTMPENQNLKHDEEWTENEIDAFTEALHKFSNDWTQIAEYVRRSEQSCRSFYLKHRKSSSRLTDERNMDEDNGSISGSEDTSRRLMIPIKSRKKEQNDEENDDDVPKTIVNEDSNDSTHEMVIDEGDEQSSMIDEKPTRALSANVSSSNLTTITSLVEKEISKTLNETEKRLLNTTTGTTNKMNPDMSPEKIPVPAAAINPTASTLPPPLVTLARPHSSPNHSHSNAYPSSHNQHSYSSKGSIMRGTPVAASPSLASPSNKPISIDTSTAHSHLSPHHYSSPRNEYSHHPSSLNDSSHMKSSKVLDRNLEQHQLYLQQQQQQQQQHQAAYIRHYSQQQATHGNFPPSPQYAQQQQHKSSPLGNQQQKLSTTPHKSMGIEGSNTDTFETLRADFLTSRYLTTTHSPNHERHPRHPSEQRSPSQSSTSSSNNPTLLPPPAAIAPPTSMQSSAHVHPSQQQAAILAASQLLASSGMYSQELLASGLLPYSPYYGSLPGAPFFIDPRVMHEFAAAAANNEQLKNSRSNRPHPHASAHSPPDQSTSSTSPYSTQSSKRHPHESIEHMRYPTGDYATPIWRTQNLNSAQQMHSQLKSHSGANENPLLKPNELSRHSTRVIPPPPPPERDTRSRSPDDFHIRSNQSRGLVESPSIHFQRSEAHSHHKSSSHDKFSAGLHFSEHPTDGHALSYMRQSTGVQKPQPTHHHLHTSSASNRTPAVPSSQISPNHASTYMLHGLQHSPVGAISPRQQQSPHHSQSHYSQQRSSHHNELSRQPKEPISIQEFMKKNVNDFVSSSNSDTKNSNSDLSLAENSSNQLSRAPQLSILTGPKSTDSSDQPILIDGDDDSNSAREQNQWPAATDGNTVNRSSQEVNKSSTMESDMPERRRDSSIKKILSNQPLEKQEYVEINQKVQNSTVGASKVHSSSDMNGLERTNSIGGRESARSRGSITMRMLMGANGIYADGKAQPITPNELNNEPANKRAASPGDKSESLEYLIRGELDRACPQLPKRDESSSIFQNRHSSSHASPVQQQRSLSNLQAPPSSKRLRTDAKDDGPSNNESRSSNQDTPSQMRDPFALQTQTKNAHHGMPQSLSSSSAPPPPQGNTDRNWQSYVQQQYQSLSTSFASRSSRPTNTSSGSITQGSPISSSARLSTDQQQFASAANNQLVNPRYSYYMNKHESQFSPTGQSSAAPQDHSPKGKFSRRLHQNLPSPSDASHESYLPNSADPPSNLKSPPINPIRTSSSSLTPPLIVSPVSSSASPTTSVSSNSAHPLKKRLISEYEFEQQQQQQQQRNSPATISPAVSTPTPPPAITKPEATSTTLEQHADDDAAESATAKETAMDASEEGEHST